MASNIIGPIVNGSSFIITSIQDGAPYILNTSSDGNNKFYYWENDLNVLGTGTNMGVFTAQGNIGAVTISDNTNSGGIVFASNNLTITNNASNVNPININQQHYTNWFPQNTFLSGIPYTIYNDNGATANILTSASITGATIDANNINLVPVNWYFDCGASGTYDSISTPLDSALNWYCLIEPSGTGCSSLILTEQGWSELSDCQVGQFYTYCPTGSICGANGCKGPCNVIYDDCEFNSNNFTCVFNPENYIDETDWWESAWFIGFIVLMIVIIIIIIIIIVKR